MEKKQKVLSVDVMYFTVIAFLITVSRMYKFITLKALKDRERSMIFEALKQATRDIMKDIGFSEFDNPIHTILADNEFESLRSR
jgi:hypothetical protein